jgi:large subunit ribosomal protein L9
MKIFLLKDVEKVGLAGEIIKVSDGYATNFILPRKLGVQVTPANEASLLKKLKTIENRKEAISTATSMLAEKIKALKITLKRKLHDDGKLYGSVNPSDIADLLAAQGVKVAKNQILLDKTIKEKGSYDVTVKLSSRLQPSFSLKVVSE